jgi:hypothetical protein
LNHGKIRAPRQSVLQRAQPTVGNWNAKLPFGQLEFEFYFFPVRLPRFQWPSRRPENFLFCLLLSAPEFL